MDPIRLPDESRGSCEKCGLEPREPMKIRTPNLSVAAAIGKLLQGSPDTGTTGKLTELLASAARSGVTGEPAAKFLR